jgi:hypothetical protein
MDAQRLSPSDQSVVPRPRRSIAAFRLAGPRLALGLWVATLAALVYAIRWLPEAGVSRASSPRTIAMRPTAPSPPKLPSAEDLARPHLRWAQGRCARALDAQMASLDGFFRDAKRRTPRFAERALSWSSKWRFVADYIPGTRGDRHQQFLRESFAQHVFEPKRLEAAVREVIAGYLADVRSIENQMLVRLRADLANLPNTALTAAQDHRQLQASFDRAIARAVAATGSSLRADLAGELVSTIAGEVLAQVAVRLGVSAGILGTGAASSWATFGAGLVVALIVDQLVSWVWNKLADPVGDLALELQKKLDELHGLIVWGSQGSWGLRDRLGQFSRQRGRLREAAVLELVRSSLGEAR